MKTPVDVPIHTAESFARHLRENPRDAARPVHELAKEFGLPERFVSEVVDALHGRSMLASTSVANSGRHLGNRLAAAYRSVRDRFARVSANSERFILVTTLSATFLIVILSLLGVAGTVQQSSGGSGFNIQSRSPAVAAVVLITLVLHGMNYFRQGMARHVLYGALIVWLIVAPSVVTTFWIVNAIQPEPAPILGTLVVLTLAILLLCGLYAVTFLGISMVGGVLRVKSEERAERNMSRQELLERLFYIQEKLKPGNAGTLDLAGESRLLAWLRRFERPLPGIALACGVVGGFGSVALFALLPQIEGQRAPLGMMVAFFVLQIVMSVGSVLATIGIGFVSRGFGRMLLNGALYVAGSYVAFLMPWPDRIRQMVAEQMQLQPTLVAFAFTALFLLFGHFGRTIEERAARQRRLRASDPAALLAEMVRIQWMLSPSAHSVCVMVVDAAKSSTMKAAADPLVVEWTFREYQKFIERISNACGGTVYSTAGDGAVVAFPTSAQAFAAARRIQCEVSGFNQSVNRLPMPFRLRIGLHCGEVVAALDKVEYTEVIDIAAHIEAEAPIGGIAMSATVAQELSGERLAELKTVVDGLSVYVALDPTGSD